MKAVIARQGGLVDLEWYLFIFWQQTYFFNLEPQNKIHYENFTSFFFRDGQLKRLQVKKEWKELQQQEYSKKILGENVIEWNYRLKNASDFIFFLK